jgi:hypothetical protein
MMVCWSLAAKAEVWRRPMVWLLELKGHSSVDAERRFEAGLVALKARRAEHPPPPFRVAAPLAIGSGMLIFYVLAPLIERTTLASTLVIMRQFYLFRVGGSRVSKYRYEDLGSFRWGRDGDCRTLRLTLRKGTELTMGVPETVPIDRVTEFLASRGVMVDEAVRSGVPGGS